MKIVQPSHFISNAEIAATMNASTEEVTRANCLMAGFSGAVSRCPSLRSVNILPYKQVALGLFSIAGKTCENGCKEFNVCPLRIYLERPAPRIPPKGDGSLVDCVVTYNSVLAEFPQVAVGS